MSPSSPTAVVAGILVENGKVLVSRRLPQDSYGGKWEFPGGTVDDESPEAALRRELFEELGLRVSVGERFVRVSAEKQGGETVVIDFYWVKRLPGSPPPRALEVAAWRWMRPRDLARLDFIPSNVQVIRKLRQTHPGHQRGATIGD